MNDHSYEPQQAAAVCLETAAAVDNADVINSTFHVEGLDCADCAAKLEKAIQRLQGVTDAQMNFAAAKIKVAYDGASLQPSEILKVISGFGYNASLVKAAHDAPGLRKTVLRIGGLDCAECAAALEKRIVALAGVHAANINFGAGKLTVEHTIPLPEILLVIRQAGYQAGSIDHQPEYSQTKIAWWNNTKTLGTILSGIFLVVATTADLWGVGEEFVTWLYFAAILTGGYNVAKSGLYGLRTLTLDTNLLMVIAVLGAIMIGELSEGATVVFLFAIGNALQAYTMDKTRQSIRTLMELAPREAIVRRDGQELTLPVEDIMVDDIIIVKPGERIAMDGVILTGASAVNQAAITGESLPAEKNQGDTVYAGTVNGQGALEITVTRLAEDSTLAKIMHLVEEAQAEKAPLQQFVDVFAKYYTPAVIIGAIALALIPWLVFNQPAGEWFYRALILLVISCPCALVISTPVSIVSAIGNASRHGVLIKGGAYLEQMGIVEAIAFDKTGTLTRGQPIVTDIVPLKGITADELLAAAAAVEKWSEHPIAQAIVTKAGELTVKPSSDFKALTGKGAQAIVDGRTIYTGNLRLFEELDHILASCKTKQIEFEQQGKTVIFVGTTETVYGMIAVADQLRDNSKEAMQRLRSFGVRKIVMLTGDNNRVAKTIAEELKLDSFYSELLPQDKVNTIKRMARHYGTVAMVGDGINDAPALAAANIGIAMGVAGSDAALETADIALMADDLGKLAYIIRLSRKTVRIIKQNISFSVIVKLLFVLATFAGAVNLWMAVFADTGAAVLVTLNGMRLVREIRM